MMSKGNQIDITFDFRSDTHPGKDPDARSPTLRRYHKLLWSKPLPCGVVFELVDTVRQEYLYHQSEMGEFFLSSDSVIPTFMGGRLIPHVIHQIPEWELEAFNSIGYTMGGMMIFPSNRIGRKMTINGARGFNNKIKDRFDLTVECIRRHYLREWSPLCDVLDRYADFFNLFESFSGYVEFFLLQDIVTEDFSAVKFFMPFDNFQTSPLPSNRETYILYMKLAVEFIKARNSRILDAG